MTHSRNKKTAEILGIQCRLHVEETQGSEVPDSGPLDWLLKSKKNEGQSHKWVEGWRSRGFLCVATCSFPLQGSISKNAKRVF